MLLLFFCVWAVWMCWYCKCVCSCSSFWKPLLTYLCVPPYSMVSFPILVWPMVTILRLKTLMMPDKRVVQLSCEFVCRLLSVNSNWLNRYHALRKKKVPRNVLAQQNVNYAILLSNVDKSVCLFFSGVQSKWVGVYLEAKLPSVSFPSVSLFFYSVLLLCSSSFSLNLSFIYLNLTYTRRPQLLPLKMYLAELTRNLKQETAAFNSSWKAKEICLCGSNGWGNCCSGMGSGDEDYRQNLCTKLILIRQPRHAHILTHMACMKMSKCTKYTLLTKQEPRMHH